MANGGRGKSVHLLAHQASAATAVRLERQMKSEYFLSPPEDEKQELPSRTPSFGETLFPLTRGAPGRGLRKQAACYASRTLSHATADIPS